MTEKKRNPHMGPTFESFLREEGIYEEVTAAAIKQGLEREKNREKNDEGEDARVNQQSPPV